MRNKTLYYVRITPPPSSTWIASSTELCHYGVPGMKWGVRQAREAGRDLDRKRRAYRAAKRARNRAVSRNESSYEVVRKMDAYNTARNDYKKAKNEYRSNAPTRVKVERGARKAATALAAIGTAYIVDQKFLGGVGTATVKIGATAAMKVLGMTAMTAYSMARGNANIHWTV